MSKIQEKAREKLAALNKEIASENAIYIEQMQELARQRPQSNSAQ